MMNSLNLGALTRRAFLIRSAATVGAVSPLVKVFPASALRALQDKPALSQASLAAVIQAARAGGSRAMKALAMEVRYDVRSFLRSRFALTSAQDAFISGLSATDIAGIGSAFEGGLIGQNELRIQMPDPAPIRRGVAAPVTGKCDLTVNRGSRQLASGTVVQNWSVVVVNR